MTTVNHHLVDLALDKTNGASFELFSQAFFAALTGHNFVPLGGMHDGGAEAFSTQEFFYEDQKNSNFWQASIQQDFRNKIRSTVDRIKEFNRELTQLTYCTSIVVKNLDVEEDRLSDELRVRIKIRDRKYIVSHINSSEATIQSYNSYLAPYLSHLKEIGGSTIIGYSKDLPSRTLCTFLGQEVERRRGNTQLLESVTDSLILWSLEGTDATSRIFLSREQILKKIEEALPAARQFIRGVLDNRLKALRSKDNTYGREIRWHSKENGFCLPYETRKIVEAENTEDEILKSKVGEIFRNRCLILCSSEEQSKLDINLVVRLCYRSLEITFENQGLELSYFILGSDSEDHFENNVLENIQSAVDGEDVNGSKKARLIEVCSLIIRNSFYKSEEVERVYLSKLSRTYSLLFILKNEPKIVEYFRTMSTEFILYVGSDLVIRAISERYMSPVDRMTWNLFKILEAAGATVILTDPTLDEIISHLRAQDHEYKNHYFKIDSVVTLDIAKNIDRILLRSYFYSKIEERTGSQGPSSWASYIGQFCTYTDLHFPAGKESLKRSLCLEFGFSFETLDEMKKGISDDELNSVKAEISKIRTVRRKDVEDILSYNDALHVLRVYAKRQSLNELSKPNPYGFRVWWLTAESAVRRATRELVKAKGASYMIRPEFLLNFISIAPSAEEVRKSFGKIFPSLLGIKLSNRMKPEVLESLLLSVQKAFDISENRAKARVSELSDQLKGDFGRCYEVPFKREELDQ